MSFQQSSLALSDIVKLTLPQIKAELEKHNLPTTGLESDLRSRLIGYLTGASQQDSFRNNIFILMLKLLF